MARAFGSCFRLRNPFFQFCFDGVEIEARAALHRREFDEGPGGSEGLSPTLANIKRAHVVRLGYRESSPPFSFLDQANRPIGYSLELCEAIVDEIGVEVDDTSLKIEYVKVTSDDLDSGGGAEQDRPRMRIDHRQCGAQQTGSVFAADIRGRHQADGAEGLRRSGATDLKGKTVVVTKGTTNEQAMHNVDKKFALGLNKAGALLKESNGSIPYDTKPPLVGKYANA